MSSPPGNIWGWGGDFLRWDGEWWYLNMVYKLNRLMHSSISIMSN